MIPAPHYIREGQGPPVVLLHGWGAQASLLQPVIAGLRHAYQLIAPDFPGFGQTPPPPVAWAVSDYTAWLVTLLDELGLARTHVVGHSFGGRVAITLAAEQPERVDKLVLTDSAGIRPARGPGYYARIWSYKALRSLARAPVSPPLLQRWATTQVARRGSSDYRQASGTVRASFVRVVNEDLRPLLPRIQAPTLLIWGEHDQDTPLVDARTMERLIPDAGLVIFAGAGHYAYSEQPARFNRILEAFFSSGAAP